MFRNYVGGYFGQVNALSGFENKGAKGLALILELAPSQSVTAAPAVAYALSLSSSLTCPALCERDTSLLAQKDYRVEHKSLLHAFSPKQLIFSCMRCTMLEFAPVFEQYLRALEEMDQEDDGIGEVEWPPVPDFQPALRRTWRGMIRQTAVHTTRRIMERLLSASFSARLNWKLNKELSTSIQRKAMRASFEDQFTFSRAGLTSRTVARGYIITVVSEIIVQQCMITWHTVNLLRTETRRDLRRQAWRKLTRQTVHNCAKGFGICAGASIGAGIVVLIRPRYWPRSAMWMNFVAMNVGDMIGDLTVGLLLDDWAFGPE